VIPLFKPFMPQLPQLNEILTSGNLSYGEYGKRFEKRLREYLQVDHLLTTNTYSNAMFVALTALGVRTGDSVIVSPMACLASTQPLLSFGIKVLWADVEPKTGTLSPDSVRNLVRFKPRAIIHNHYCGYVGFVDEINSIGKEYGIPVIDDCIEAFGSEYKERKMGSVGTDATIFSFGPVRIPNTIDGGAVVFSSREIFMKSLLIRDAGIDRTKFRDELGEINPECDITMIGFSATMSEVNSYIGYEQMENVGWIMKKQKSNADLWNSIDLEKYSLNPIDNSHSRPNYWVYGTLADNKTEAIIALREQGYYASGVHINNNRYSIFSNKSKLCGVDEFQNAFLALPCGWWVNTICL